MNANNKLAGRSLSSRLSIVAIGVLAYLGFHCVFLSMISFLNGGPVPWGQSTSEPTTLGFALAINLGWVAIFGLQHAVMARDSFKQRWTQIVPEPIERPLFVIATVLCLGGALMFWQTIPGTVFQVEWEPARIFLFALQAVGWLVVVWSTFLIDHFELFGLRQVWSAFRGTTLPVQRFRTPALYRYSRHPMMVGMLIGLWATPDMTWSRFVFALGFSIYTVLGVRLEEQELVENLGEDYERYQKEVPRFIALPGSRQRAVRAGVVSAVAGTALLGSVLPDAVILQSDEPVATLSTLSD